MVIPYSDPERISIASTEAERRALYQSMDIRQKIRDGQAYLVPGRIMSGPPRGDFPAGIVSRMVEIRLAVNDWFLCYAHQYVWPDGRDYTSPDPKYIRVDQVVFKQ